MPAEKKITTDYSSNSHKTKAATVDQTEKPKVEKIINGEVVERKKSLGRKFMSVFAGDDLKSVISYVAFDVAVPTLKTLISDMASQGVERALFGDSRPRAGARPGGYTSYNRVSSPLGGRSEPRALTQRARATHDFREIILPARGDAEAVLDGLQMLVDQYSVALVSDLYELVGITGSFTDNKWGWINLAGSNVRRIPEGYLVNLPQPISID